MAEERPVRKYTGAANEFAMVLDRETYKKIKHMDKVTLANYLVSVYQKGYLAGLNASITKAEPESEAKGAEV